jgi:protein gp37
MVWSRLPCDCISRRGISTTNIAWADATFSPWLGCIRVSAACDHCYAAAFSKRAGWRDLQGRDLWDPHAARKRTSAAYWRAPVRWDRAARAAGTRPRVFCSSMADVFDNHAARMARRPLRARPRDPGLNLDAPDQTTPV